MPFIAKDWRSSGDTWIKTEQGWQKAKSLQFLVSDPTNLQYIYKSFYKHKTQSVFKILSI
jgi:hypothetical protein